VKELRGSATTAVKATPKRCLAAVAAVDRYPSWYPDVIREVEVLDRDSHGVVRRARTQVHLAMGPLTNDYRFEITVTVEPSGVVLARVPDTSSDPERLEIHWRVRPRELGVDLMARLDLPRFLAVGGAGDSVAQGFVEAARRVLDDSSPKASASSS
jgi:ribosome-associated toxin RatA of RatAB toxin-antitoxin module